MHVVQRMSARKRSDFLEAARSMRGATPDSPAEDDMLEEEEGEEEGRGAERGGSGGGEQEENGVDSS